MQDISENKKIALALYRKELKTLIPITVKFCPFLADICRTDCVFFEEEREDNGVCLILAKLTD